MSREIPEIKIGLTITRDPDSILARYAQLREAKIQKEVPGSNAHTRVLPLSMETTR